MCNLGYLYTHGQGVEVDHQKAFDLYLQAAKMNYAPGLYHVALAYEEGNVVDVDIDKAIEYYQKAADLNYSAAMYNLGLIYEHNIDYHDDLKAIEYYQVAIEYNDARAMYRMALYLEDVYKRQVHLVNRLDKDTQGLMLIAKNRQAHYLLSKDIKQVKRVYHCLVEGLSLIHI